VLPSATSASVKIALSFGPVLNLFLLDRLARPP
jgi:hypothetical protein